MCSEYEKMISGELYDINDKELTMLRLKAQQFCTLFNATAPDDQNERNTLLRQMLGRTRYSFNIASPFTCHYGFNIFLGDHFQAHNNCTLVDNAPIVFGDHVILANNVALYTVDYPTNPYLRAKGIEHASPITLGNHVCVGANSVILPGITLGNNVIVGAGSVVTKSFPDNVAIAGNPAQILYSISVEAKSNISSIPSVSSTQLEDVILQATPEEAIKLKLY